VEKRTTAVLQLWREAGGRPLTVPLEGRSMAPLALPGDRVTIHPAELQALRCGDLIALLMGGTLVIHRFLGFRETPAGLRLCQKGDNTPAWSWVAADSLVGRAALIEGPQRTLDLTAYPWTRLNPLIGRLTRWRLLPPGLLSLILRIAS